MELLQKWMGKAKEDPKTLQKKKLLEEYYEARESLRRSRAAFEAVSDPDLISACIFDLNAAQSRCSYLLQRLREMDVEEPVGMIH
jgi:hypothetical protein